MIRDIERGDCFNAAARIRGIRRGLPDHQALRLLEGESFICVGNGPAARAAVSPLLGKIEGGRAEWIVAQAYLLEERPNQARPLLQSVISTDSGLRPQARVLLSHINAATD